MNKAIIFWLSVLFVFSGAAAVWSAWKLAQSKYGAPQTVTSMAVREAPPGSDAEILEEFTLTDRSGETVCSRDFEGEVWVVSFFYATCPGSCRIQNQHLAAIYREFAPQGVKFLSITCDPTVDTPERLADYARQFGAKAHDWFFLTGDMLYIRRIGAEMFSVHVGEREHMDRFIVVDKWGNVRGHFDWHDQAKLADMEETLAQALTETEEPKDLWPATARPAVQPEPEEESAEPAPRTDADENGGAASAHEPAATEPPPAGAL